MNKGARVSIDEWVVYDQTNGKSMCRTGVVVSDVTTESFNLHELKTSH